jgi:hypothetical protein
MGDQVVKTIRNASKIGEEQFKSFVEGRFIDGSKPVTDTLKKNNLSTSRQYKRTRPRSKF